MDRVQTRTDVGPASVYQPSPLSQLVGAYGVYRGMNPGQAEGGYIEGEYDDVTEYAKGGYVPGGPPEDFQMGGLASYVRGIPGRVSTWARQIIPRIGQALGVQNMLGSPPGGKFLKLDEKQD